MLKDKVKREKVDFARRLRSNLTGAEQALWSSLRRKQVGARFKRQAILRGYVADFYCPRVRLVVEVDGASHIGKEASDSYRDNALGQLGILTLRFTNSEAFQTLERVLLKIRATIDDRIKAGVQPFRPVPEEKKRAWLQARAAKRPDISNT